MNQYKRNRVGLSIPNNLSPSFSSSLHNQSINLYRVSTLTMSLIFIFLITTVIGMSDGAMKNISIEEISKIQHCVVNEFEELSGSTSNGRKRSRGTLGTFTLIKPFQFNEKQK